MLFSCPSCSKYKIPVPSMTPPHLPPQLYRASMTHLQANLTSLIAEYAFMAPCLCSCCSFCQGALPTLFLPSRTPASAVSASVHNAHFCSPSTMLTPPCKQYCNWPFRCLHIFAQRLQATWDGDSSSVPSAQSMVISV